MSKIVSAVNAMIRNEKKISEVQMGRGGEVFFLYDGKHKWSVAKRDDDTFLWFYPGNSALCALAFFENEDWQDEPLVVYKVSDIGTREARESFDDLYMLIKEKLYGVDQVLSEIIDEGADDIPF